MSFLLKVKRYRRQLLNRPPAPARRSTLLCLANLELDRRRSDLELGSLDGVESSRAAAHGLKEARTMGVDLGQEADRVVLFCFCESDFWRK